MNNNDCIKVLFSGDFVFTPTEKNFEFSEEFCQYIDDSNIFCCNLEGPIVNEDCKKIEKIGPNINNDIGAIKKLIKYNCNLMCLANNHIYDYGLRGLSNTEKILDEYGVQHIGASADERNVYNSIINEANNLKIGFINIAENGFGASIENNSVGYSYAFSDKVEELINNTKKECDYLVVISHMGAENWCIPLPEVKNFYKKLVDNGVDVVIAHHPHVPQGWEEYNNGLIFYSLGNFIFDKGVGIQKPKSFSVQISFGKNNMIEYTIIPTFFENNVLKVDNVDYKYLCGYLNDVTYYSKLNELLEQSYKNYQKNYYKIVSRDTGSFKERIKGFIKRNVLHQSFQEKWLYHNINIETHLWICQRVSRMNIEKKLEMRK